MATELRDFQANAENRPPLSDGREEAAGRRWVLRAAGGALLLAGWAVVSFVGGPVVNAGVFVALAAYAYIAAAVSRRISVDDEKRLRMELLVHNMELEKLSSKDELTQLYNRRYFLERLERELKTAKGFGRPVSMLLIDIDGMGAINARHGQRMGDEVLAGFGRFLLAQTRASDLPARVDGDRFAVILPDTGNDGADIMIERLIGALSGKPMFEDAAKGIEVSVSLGVAGYPWSSDTLDEIMQEAEIAMSVNRRARAQEIRVDAKDGLETAVPIVYRKTADDEGTPAGQS